MTGRLVLLALLLQAFLPQSGRELEKASIAGVVVRAGTTDPIEDTSVLLTKELTATADPERAAPRTWSLTTESDGKFVFKDLDPGSYRLAFASNGYVRQEYGQRILPGKGSPFEIAAGQAKGNIVVGLTPTGSVSGRIQDKDKQPLNAIPVQLMRFSYDSTGQKRLRPYGSASTDDRGEYRISYVTPGRYYICAGTPAQTTPYGLGRNEVREWYTIAFFSGVAAVSQASVLEIQAAADVRGIDLTLGKQPLFRVRGRIEDAATGQSPPQAQIYLNVRDASSGQDFNLGNIGGGRTSYENGVFEFRDIPPGSYSVEASVEDRAAPVSGATPRPRRTGNVPLQIAGADVEGILVSIKSGASLSGTVRVDGNGTLPLTRPMGIQFSPLPDSLPTGVPWPYAALNPDGTFRLDNLMPGEYRVSILGLTWGYYIRSAEIGSVDVLSKPLRFTGSGSESLELLISPGVASIEGIVQGEKLELMAAAQVVLVPERNRDRIDLFRNVSSDENGRFTIPNVPPGDYRVFAWEVLEPYAYFDPETLRLAEPKSQLIHAAELSTSKVEIRAIPAATR